MPHCTQCGAAVSEDARYCPNCGRPQAATWTPDEPAAQSGISQNAAALLSYVLGWITGLIFLLIDKRPFVRFHATQSLVTFGGLHLIRVMVGAVFGVGWWYFGGWANLGLGALLRGCIELFTFVLWVVCMVKAYQGVRFKLPIAGDIAEGFGGR